MCNRVIGSKIRECPETSTVKLVPGKVYNHDLKGRITKPARSLLDPQFKYVPACATDLAETFRRARAEIRARQERSI
jgi:hypothetical protein